MLRTITLASLLAAALALTAPSVAADDDEVCFDTAGLICYDPSPGPGPEPGDELCFATIGYCVEPLSPSVPGLAKAVVEFVKDQIGPCTCDPEPTPI